MRSGCLWRHRTSRTLIGNFVRLVHLVELRGAFEYQGLLERRLGHKDLPPQFLFGPRVSSLYAWRDRWRISIKSRSSVSAKSKSRISADLLSPECSSGCSHEVQVGMVACLNCAFNGFNRHSSHHDLTWLRSGQVRARRARARNKGLRLPLSHANVQPKPTPSLRLESKAPRLFLHNF